MADDSLDGKSLLGFPPSPYLGGGINIPVDFSSLLGFSPSDYKGSDRVNVPVLIGVVPLLTVTSFVLEEGYKTAAIASSKFTQLVAPTTKSIKIDALLIKELRALRPALEALALTSRGLASATAPLLKLAGIPVVAKNGVHLDMQITSLVFTQDNQMRDTLRVLISLVNVPRTKLGGLLGGALDLATGVGTAFI